jgi:transcriptional regulator with XRE-family HTH domain
MSQAAIARELSISDKAWREYESGAKSPGSHVIAGLVKLGLNANWLLTGEGSLFGTLAEGKEDDTPLQAIRREEEQRRKRRKLNIVYALDHKKIAAANALADPAAPLDESLMAVIVSIMRQLEDQGEIVTLLGNDFNVVLFAAYHKIKAEGGSVGLIRQVVSDLLAPPPPAHTYKVRRRPADPPSDDGGA